MAAIVPPPSATEREAGLTYALKLLNGYGLTAMQDAQVFEDDLKTYRALERRHELTMRVVAAIWWEHTQGLEQIDRIKRLRGEYASPLIDPGTVKIMQDGVLENYTAVLLQPYLKKPGNVRGIPMVDPELLKEAVTLSRRCGLPGALPRDRGRRRARIAGCHRGSQAPQRGSRTSRSHLASRAGRSGGRTALPRTRRHRELPASVGIRG